MKWERTASRTHAKIRFEPDSSLIDTLDAYQPERQGVVPTDAYNTIAGHTQIQVLCAAEANLHPFRTNEEQNGFARHLP
jgi:hypothetical protein